MEQDRHAAAEALGDQDIVRDAHPEVSHPHQQLATHALNRQTRSRGSSKRESIAGRAEKRLDFTQHQKPPGRERPGKGWRTPAPARRARSRSPRCGTGSGDSCAGGRRIVAEVGRPNLHPLAQPLDYPALVSILLEVPLNPGRRQLGQRLTAVAAGPGALEALPVDVGCVDRQVTKSFRRALLLQMVGDHHGQGVRLLARRAAGTPHPDLPLVRLTDLSYAAVSRIRFQVSAFR